MNREIFKHIEGVIFSIRWMMLPLYAGLIIALGVYVMHFIHEVYEMVLNWYANTAEQNILMLFILELVDMTLISRLVVLIVQSDYASSIKDTDVQLPKWIMNSLSSTDQKIKMGMTIIGIMMVHMLKDYIQNAQLDYNALVMRMELMGCVIGGTLSFCVINILMHLPMLKHGNAPASAHDAKS